MHAQQLGIQKLTTETPRHKHDCDRCQFLGWFQDYDLYYCDQSPHNIPTVIARYGRGGDYLSGMPKTAAGPVVPLQVARYRAIRDGLYNPEDYR